MTSGATTRPVVVVGGGGHAAEVVSYLSHQKSGDAQVVAVLDERLESSPFEGVPLLGSLDELSAFARSSPTAMAYTVAVGDNAARLSLVDRIEALGVGLEAIVLSHLSSHVGDGVELGAGTCLAPGAVITTRASVGRHCILNVKASVAHDCRIGDFVNLNPASTVCGWVQIGDGAYVGAGATVIDHVHVGAWSVLGAGAVAVTDIPAGVVAVGVPARPIRKINENRSHG